MIPSSEEVDSPSKQQVSASNHEKNITRASSSTSSSWSRLKDPRIVRVSRAFGGKDRHSKVCTIRGLRDRRVRLSVPTAIQLYDLQDRLGLNQPSKVVDWLLNAAKHEIDELPPLPMPLPGNFALNHQSFMLNSHDIGASQSEKEGFKVNNAFDWGDPGGFQRSNIIWNSESLWRGKSKGIERDDQRINIEKENWIKGNEERNQDQGIENHGEKLILSNSTLSRTNHSNSSQGLANNSMPIGSYSHWESSNFPSSHLGSHGFTSQTEDHLHNFNIIPLQSTLSLSPRPHFLVRQPENTQSLFSSNVSASVEVDPRKLSHFQILSPSQTLFPNSIAPSLYSIGQSIRPFHINRVCHSQNAGENQQDKDREFPPK